MFHLPLCPVHYRLPRNYLCILARGSSSGPLWTRNSKSLNHFLQVCQFNKCLPKGHLSSCLPLFLSLLVCLWAGAFWLLSPAHRLHTSLALNRMQPSLESMWLTPVSEVANWHPLHFLHSFIFLPPSLLHISTSCCSHREQQQSFPPSLHQRPSLPHGSWS